MAQPALDTPPPLIPGYEIEVRIGTGGMGEVWRARHELLGRPAAIKLMREGSGTDPGRHARFGFEARSTSKLRSPNSIEVYDFGVADNGAFFLAMELLDGVDLRRLVERFGPLPAERVAYILIQLCDSLQDAHRQGLVHHDVKPANVMTTRAAGRFDFVKLLDFGLARAIGCDRNAATTPRRLTGTPAYIAPEIVTADCRGECHVDGRADIYSLGCVAFWLLTDALLFDADTPEEMALAHVTQTPPSPTTRTELPIPRELEAILMACLAKDPALRPQSAVELAEGLLRVPFEKPWSNERARAWWESNMPTPG